MKIHVFILFVLSFFGCTSGNRENENVKLHIVNGKKQGKEIRYFETGEILSERMWKDGKLEGKLIHFYQTGDTMEIQSWKNGLKQGKTTKYYPDGTIRYVTNFDNDVTVGKTISYRKDGTISYVQQYDKKGELTHEFAYDTLGNILNNYPFPIILPDKDTINFNQNNQFEIRILNPDSTLTMGIDFGTLKEKENGTVEIKDTLHIVEKKGDKFFMTIKPEKRGKFHLTGLWYYTDTTLRSGGNRDTIESTTYYSIEKEYFVK